MKRRIINFLCIGCMVLVCLTGCGQKDTESSVDWNKMSQKTEDVEESVDDGSLSMSEDVNFQVPVRKLKDLISSQEFDEASEDERQTLLSAKLDELAEAGEIWEDYSYDSVSNGYLFTTSDGVCYVVSSEGVEVR